MDIDHVTLTQARQREDGVFPVIICRGDRCPDAELLQVCDHDLIKSMLGVVQVNLARASQPGLKDASFGEIMLPREGLVPLSKKCIVSVKVFVGQHLLP